MEQREIGLIALDLDGTLLDSHKVLSERNYKALEAAARKGIAIVPTTGRFFSGMPKAILELPFLRYAITINGARVYDAREDAVLRQAEMPAALAVDIMTYLDGHGVAYDCYQDDWGWMTADTLAQAESFAPDRYYLDLISRLRTPVPELKAYIGERGQGVQKVQAYFREDQTALRGELLKTLGTRFPDTAVSSASPRNIEINSAGASKGKAMLALAEHLGLRQEQTMAFGDGLNDLSMLTMAGTGVAMANACPEALAAAPERTASCDEDGVALAIERICL